MTMMCNRDYYFEFVRMNVDVYDELKHLEKAAENRVVENQRLLN